ncbi:MAG: hypothetical protein IJ491_01100 [Clostridia bacterium]|nr:hypothetical protein [Clostridia bacterium]
MENFLDKIFNNELVYAVRDFFARIAEKIEGLGILNRTPSKRFIIIAFSSVIALLVIISSAFVIADNRSEDESITTDAGTTSGVAAVASQSTKEIDATFLLALTDNDKAHVHSIIIAHFNSGNEELTLDFVDPDISVTVNDSTGSMQQHLQTGGISQFLWAISEHSGKGFNRYLIADEAAFVELMSMLGDTVVEIPGQISYDHSGIKFIIDKGTQSLTADMMLKYYLYLTYTATENSQQIYSVLTDILTRLLTAENDTLLEERFCKALGLFTTDISAIDFSNHKDAIRAIPGMGLMNENPASEE